MSFPDPTANPPSLTRSALDALAAHLNAQFTADSLPVEGGDERATATNGENDAG